MNFTTPNRKTLFLRGLLLRWDGPKDKDCSDPWTFLWMATIPTSNPMSSTFGNVFGGQFTPVGWRAAPALGSQANLFPVPNHYVDGTRKSSISTNARLHVLTEGGLGLAPPGRYRQAPPAQGSCGEIFLHRVNCEYARECCYYLLHTYSCFRISQTVDLT